MHDLQTNRIRLKPQFECRTFVGTVVAVAGLGLGAASAAGAFTPSVNTPNTAKEAEQMQALEAQYLPAILGLEAAQQEGGSYTLPADVAAELQKLGINLPQGAATSTETANAGAINSQISALQKQLQGISPTTQVATGKNGLATQANPAYTKIQQQIAGLQEKLQKSGASGGSDTINFAGQGTADVQGQIEQQLAAGQLAEGQKYDPQFIAQALAEEQQANPQGVAARTAEYNDIQNSINNPQPVSPVSTTMNNQVQEQVAAGSNLTPEEQQMLQSAVSASGGGNGTNFGTDLTTGFAGEQRALENAGSGATWLSSGETPQDIQEREMQQNIANLGSFVGGQTPENQFSELSGAGSSPTPNFQSGYLPSYSGNAAAQLGASAGASQYSNEADLALNSASPWTAGLSAVLGGTKALAGAGVV